MVRQAIESARRALTRATGKWADSDEAREAQQHAGAAMEHLEAGRWDDAQARAELALELDESHGSGELWRNFCLLVEEAAELGRDEEI